MNPASEAKLNFTKFNIPLLERRGAACTAPRRLDLVLVTVAYCCLLSTAKRHRDLVGAVPSPRYAYSIRIGSPPIAVEVVGIETTLVRHGGNQHAVAIDVDETRGRPTPEEVHRLQAVHFVTIRVQRDLHWRRCRCRRCSRRSRRRRRRRGRGCWRWCGCRTRANRAVEVKHRGRDGASTIIAACHPDAIGPDWVFGIGIGRKVTPRVWHRTAYGPRIANRIVDIHFVRRRWKSPAQY